MKKDEQYVRDLLIKSLEGVGNFQKAEFCTNQMETRPDYVVLGDNFFNFYEIKSELDSFARVKDQINLSMKYYTSFYLVINRDKFSKIKKIVPSHWNIGYHFIEDLEAGFKEPAVEPKRKSDFVSIDAVADILWVENLRHYVKQKLPNAFTHDYHGKKTLATMSRDPLEKYFKLIYSSKESLKILNEVLAGRSQEELF